MAQMDFANKSPHDESPHRTADVFRWTIRALHREDESATIYARNHSFVVRKGASFRSSDASPSGVEYLLGALGGDLVTSLGTAAARRGIAIDDIEMRVTGNLSNPLVALGVVGEQGRAGFEQIEGTVYVSTDAEAAVVHEIWKEVLSRSPLFDTLRTAIPLRFELKVGP